MQTLPGGQGAQIAWPAVGSGQGGQMTSALAAI